MTIDVNPGDGGETLWVIADRIRFLGGLPNSDLELIEVMIPPGSGVPLHAHASSELFYVIEGELTFRHAAAGDQPKVTVAGPGASIRVESMAAHGYANEGDSPVRVLVLTERPMIAFFRDLGTAEPQAQPDFDRIGAAMQRHGVEALPPANASGPERQSLR